MAHFLGIDIGTSSAKTVVIDECGKVLFATAPEYPFQNPRPNWAECDPEDWWQAVLKALKAVFAQPGISPTTIAGIGLTGQMHGLVLLDAKGQVLRPCIMWNDQRTATESEELTTRIGAQRIIQITGNPILTGFTAPKIAWVKKHEPAIYARTAKILLPKDYIRYRLSGIFAGEVSDASGTSLLNVSKRTWSDEILNAMELPRSLLPDLTESTAASTSVSESAAKATGLLAGTPIIAGGGDQAAGAIGCGIVREGLVSATFGTSGVVFAHSDTCRVEPEGRLHAFCSSVPGKWHLMGVMLSAAGSYQWYRNMLCHHEIEEGRRTGRDAYEILNELAQQAPAGCEGLQFLPYLSGERTPHPDPDARGVFFGLSLRHGKPHLTRAVLEGITYGMRDSLELIKALGIAPSQIVISGGGAKSNFWRGLMADIFKSPVATVNATEGAAYGAALLASVGTGAHPSVEAACDAALTGTGETLPTEQTALYDDFYTRYRALYPALSGEFKAMARTVEKHLAD